MASIEDEDRLREPSRDRLERHLDQLADNHLGKWVERRTLDSLCAAGDTGRVDPRLQEREEDAKLPQNRSRAVVRVLEGHHKRLNRQVEGNHAEQDERFRAPGEEHSDDVVDVRGHVEDA